MDHASLPTGLWVEVQLARCTAEGRAGVLLNRGDRDSGEILIKYRLRDGRARLLGRQRDLEGRLGWAPLTRTDPDEERPIDIAIERRLARDPDLWVLEIEIRDPGDHPLADAL